MSQEFEGKIRKIEQELIDLKTATEFTSIKSASFNTTTNVTTGTYQITYQISEGVMSQVYCGSSGGDWGMAYARTPSGNTQVVEVATDKSSGGSISTYSVPLVIASNSPVVSIVRL